MWQLILVLVLLIPLLAIVLDSSVGRALASRLERRSLDGPSDLMAERIAFLEGEMERLTSEIGRLDEESQFVTKLLSERSESTGAALPPGDDSD
ncbi:MAG: hypothetical protein IIB36_17225 [Gemmatimonadetes bacterium]|nr:hypothetical protein [Gemmatimonadota bacterium]